MDSQAPGIFKRCVEAIEAGVLIQRESSKDKEFHFQNWFIARLDDTSLNYEQGGRNSYRGFRLVQFTEIQVMRASEDRSISRFGTRSGLPKPGSSRRSGVWAIPATSSRAGSRR